MIVASVLLAVIIIIALLRIGVRVEYGANGFTASARIGPVSMRVFPRKVETPEKAEKKKKQREAKKAKKAIKAKRAKKAKKEPEKEKPGAFKIFLDMIPVAKKTLGRLRRRLLIKNLTIRFTAGGEDPSKTGLTFGAANAAFNTIMPALETVFRIRRRRLSAAADFSADRPEIYVKAIISLAVWEIVYIAFAILPAVGIISGKTSRKDELSHGKAADKRADGDDNAESQRNDRR